DRLGQPACPYTTLFRAEEDGSVGKRRGSKPKTGPWRLWTRRMARRRPGMKASRVVASWRRVRVWPSRPKITSWWATRPGSRTLRSEEHTSELQSRENLV